MGILIVQSVNLSLVRCLTRTPAVLTASKAGLIKPASRTASKKELRRAATVYPSDLPDVFPERDDEDQFLRKNIRL